MHQRGRVLALADAQRVMQADRAPALRSADTGSVTVHAPSLALRRTAGR
jgi:hypothetical protein